MFPSPTIRAAETAPENADLVLFLAAGSFVPRRFRKEEFDGSTGSIACWQDEERREYYVGLGESGGDPIPPAARRNATAVAVRRAGAAGCAVLACDVSDLDPPAVEAIAEGVHLGSYDFDSYLATKKKAVSRFVVVGPKKRLKEIRAALDRGSKRATAANFARHLANLPGNEIDPPTLADHAGKLAAGNGLRCRVWTRADLEKEGFGGLLAVGGGSAKEPCLIRLDHRCDRKGAPTVAVVGKAITFDSGGLCLKQAEQMGEMKFDKAGGCAVLGILKAVAALKIPCNVTGILAAAENMTGASAFRPGDIIRSYDGTTIEVINTDAEGRVVLADALGYVREKIRPDVVIDLATLTGACVVALGEERAGLFSDDSDLVDRLLGASDETGEALWRLPLGEEFTEAVRGKTADLRNLGTTRWGGASTAAAFLAHWTKGLRHAHIDLAGPAMPEKEKPGRAPGATGYGVRLVVRFLEKLAADQSP